MDNIFEKISLTLILLKIFDIYFFCYLATNEEIAITHLWHAIELVLSRHSLLPILSFARSIMCDIRMRFFKSDCKDISIFI